MYSCPGCGSQMTFDIAGQQLKCGRCERTMSIIEADELEARQAGSSFSADVLSCPTCGAQIHAVNAAAAAFCSYCGSSVMLEQKKKTEIEAPEKVAPFQVTREQCFEKYQDMLKHSFCVDHTLKRDIKPESFRGIYVPYHTYRSWVKGTVGLEGNETKGNTTYYYKTEVELNHQYEGILHDASKEMPDELSEKISHVEQKDFMPFSPAYLSGFYADVADTSPNAYIPYARSEAVRKGLEDTMADLNDGLTYQPTASQKQLLKLAKAEYTGDTLVPVWFMSMKSKGRVLYAVQNGVTGDMWADRPLDIPRFALVTAVLAVLLFVIFNMFLTLRPEMAMVVAMLLAVGAQFAVNGRRRTVFNRENRKEAAGKKVDDILEQVKETTKLAKKAENGSMYATLGSLGVIGAGVALAVGMYLMSEIGDIRFYKIGALALTAVMAAVTLGSGKKRSSLPWGSIAALVAMAIGCVLLILDPFHSDDRAFYLVTAGIMAAVIWECVDLLRVYNRSCSNPLPQFESHTGGEDLA